MKAKHSTVDNSSDGNCMYYAYSISLMSYLCTKGNKAMAEGIFAKLKLDDGSQKKLIDLIDIAKNRQFTRAEITNIIEPILGKATRALGAEQTKINFLAKPTDSPIFTSAKYGIEHAFLLALRKNKSELAKVVQQNKFDNENFTEAEIYKVPNMKRSMNKYADKLLSDPEQLKALTDEFNKNWAEKEKELSKRPKAVSPADILFYKREILSLIIEEKTIQFFRDNNNSMLNAYTKLLNTNYQWGSDETLNILHGAIRGERMIRTAGNRAEFVTDNDISLCICNGGVPTPGAVEKPDIVLNNLGGAHWVSLIYAQPARNQTDTTKEQSAREYMLYLVDLGKAIAASKKFLTTPAAPDDKSKAMHAELTAARQHFVSTGTEKSRVTDVKVLADSCKQVMTKYQPELKKDSFFMGILKAFIHALDFVANMINSVVYSNIVSETVVVKPTPIYEVRMSPEYKEAIEKLKDVGERVEAGPSIKLK